MASIEHGGDIFAIARKRGWDWREVLDFSASINPLGPAPGVNAAICRAVERVVHYPEREPVRLQRALAELWGLDERQVLVGNGATELIFFLARMMEALPVTLALPVFSEFHRAFPGAAVCDLEDVDSWPEEGLLVLTRPANPTGYVFHVESLRGRQNPILVDESFLEFTGRRSAAELIGADPSILVLRSLTKFYALPGLRIGALVGSAEVMDGWRERREPWQVNVLAEEAALAAVADRGHAARSVQFVQGEREWLMNKVTRIGGCVARASEANYLCVEVQGPAAGLRDFLLDRKILVRVVGERCVRVAVRTRPENERLLREWKAWA